MGLISEWFKQLELEQAVVKHRQQALRVAKLEATVEYLEREADNALIKGGFFAKENFTSYRRKADKFRKKLKEAQKKEKRIRVRI